MVNEDLKYRPGIVVTFFMFRYRYLSYLFMDLDRPYICLLFYNQSTESTVVSEFELNLRDNAIDFFFFCSDLELQGCFSILRQCHAHSISF